MEAGQEGVCRGVSTCDTDKYNGDRSRRHGGMGWLLDSTPLPNAMDPPPPQRGAWNCPFADQPARWPTCAAVDSLGAYMAGRATRHHCASWAAGARGGRRRRVVPVQPVLRRRPGRPSGLQVLQGGQVLGAQLPGRRLFFYQPRRGGKGFQMVWVGGFPIRGTTPQGSKMQDGKNISDKLS